MAAKYMDEKGSCEQQGSDQECRPKQQEWESAQQRRYRLGLVSISFRKYEPEAILAEMQKAGLSCIEWGSDVHGPKEGSDNLRRLAALQKEYGITCCSYGTYFRLGVTPLEELPGYMDAAEILGTNILRLWCGDKNGDSYSEKEREALFADCRAAARMAEERNMILCMECHYGTFTNEKESALALMEAVDSPAFRMYWQPWQFRSEEGNMEYAKALAAYTEHVHVFQWKKEQRFPLKEGVEEWKRYLSNFNGERALLLEFMPDDRLESLATEAEALRKIAES